MNNNNNGKACYGNWISIRLIRKCVVMFLLFGIMGVALWIFVPGILPVKAILALLTIFFLSATVYFLLARRLFSPEGGNIQNRVLDLLVSYIAWSGNGKALDIGCGSAALTIAVAKRFSKARITGIDYWGKGWGYCKKQCEDNACIEGVANRTEFLQASASKLPIEDDTFDLVVSNLTFHEVKDSKNKIDVIKEALRVLKPGGKFVFQDLFLMEWYYGTPDELVAAVKAAGVKDVHFVNTSTSFFIPRALKLPFMIGTLGLIYGEK